MGKRAYSFRKPCVMLVVSRCPGRIACLYQAFAFLPRILFMLWGTWSGPHILRSGHSEASTPRFSETKPSYVWKSTAARFWWNFPIETLTAVKAISWNNYGGLEGKESRKLPRLNSQLLINSINVTASAFRVSSIWLFAQVGHLEVPTLWSEWLASSILIVLLL